MRLFLLILSFLFCAKLAFGQENKLGVLPLEPKFEYVDCGCAGNIVVKIFNGLYPPYGGDEVIDKIGIGAVTVANLNDTDGDDPQNNNIYLDKDDLIVRPSPGLGFGRNEVDLMKFIVDIDGILPQDCDKKIKLELNGPLKLWKTSDKVTEELKREFQVGELPLTLYIETTEMSVSVRDMSIKTFFANKIIDEAKITSIWCGLSKTYCDRTITSIPQYLDKKSVIDYITKAESYYDLSKSGFGSFTKKNLYDDDFGGRYILEIFHSPRNLDNLDITFDLTQRVEVKDKNLPTGQNNFVFRIENFPVQVELPNDASHNFNDDSEPKNSFMYYWDQPSHAGIHSLSGINAFVSRDLNFQTFCRLSINNKSAFEFGKVNLENIISSRCSNYDKWELKYLLKSENDDDIFYPNELDDPYNSDYHKYKMVSSIPDHSFPIRNSLSSGNGIINIMLHNNSITAGYALKFQSSVWYLIEDLKNTIASSTFINGKWVIYVPNKLNIEITIGSIPFNDGAEFYFNVINEPINNYLNCH